MSATPFADIPIRGCDDVFPSWWNVLRAAGAYWESILGTGTIAETQQTITDGASATSVTGLLLSSTTHVRAKIVVSTMRTDGTNTRAHMQELTAIYNAKIAAWELFASPGEAGDSATASARSDALSRVNFTITSGGQVQYACEDTMGGTYVGKMRWKVLWTISVET